MKIQLLKYVPLALTISILFFCSCKLVEIQSKPKNFKIKLISNNTSLYGLYIHKGAGKYDALTPAKNGIYNISIPVMTGGYTEFIFIRYNKHIPEEYKILLIKKNGITYKELSINDLEKIITDDKEGDDLIKIRLF